MFNLTCGYLLVPTRANLGQAFFRVHMDPPNWFPPGLGESEEMRKRRWNEYQSIRAAEEESKRNAQAGARGAQQEEGQPKDSQEGRTGSQGSGTTGIGLFAEQVQVSLLAAAAADRERSVGPPR